MFQRFQSDSTSARRWWPRTALRRLLLSAQLALGFTVVSAIAPPASPAAEKIHFHYGLYELTVTRQELETFAATGTAEG